MTHMANDQSTRVRAARRGGVAVALGLVALTLAGCGSSDDTTSTSTPKAPTTTVAPATPPKGGMAVIDGRTFLSQAVTGHALAPGSAITLTATDGRLGVNAGCNTMSAPYALAEARLQWTEPAAGTEMACEDALMAQDTWISGLLTEGMDATLAGETLTLTSGAVTITLLDKTVAEPAKPLVGTTWQLGSIVEDGSVSSVPDGVETPTLVLTEAGDAQVFTGCNRGGGGYGIGPDGTTIEFGAIAQTRMACKGPAAAVEVSVSTTLDGSVSFVIDGNQLTLTKGNQGLVYAAS